MNDSILILTVAFCVTAARPTSACASDGVFNVQSNLCAGVAKVAITPHDSLLSDRYLLPFQY